MADNTLYIVVAIAVVLGGIWNFRRQNSGKNQQILSLSSAVFEQHIEENENAEILDVRTREEYLTGFLPKAVHLDFLSPEFKANLEALDKSKHYYLYCKSGSRSIRAAKEMQALGFRFIYNLKTGIVGWKGEIER